MKITKRNAKDIVREDAHGGSGGRKVYAAPEHLKNMHFEMMTHGFLPGGATFDWHDHSNIEEIMVVLKGSGEVHDEDGIYDYEPGDVFVFPTDTKHKIHNPTAHEHEMVFVRVKM